MTSLSARRVQCWSREGPPPPPVSARSSACSPPAAAAAAARPTTSNDDIATVGKLHIAKTRFVDELNRARASMTAQKQKFPKEGTTAVRADQVAGDLAARAGEGARARGDKLGIDVTDAQVTQRIASIKKDQFGGSETKFQAELKKEGLTEAETRAIVKGILVSDAAHDAHHRATSRSATTRSHEVLRRAQVRVPGHARGAVHPRRQEQGADRGRPEGAGQGSEEGQGRGEADRGRVRRSEEDRTGRSTTSSRAAPSSPRWRRSTRRTTRQEHRRQADRAEGSARARSSTRSRSR